MNAEKEQKILEDELVASNRRITASEDAEARMFNEARDLERELGKAHERIAFLEATASNKLLRLQIAAKGVVSEWTRMRQGDLRECGEAVSDLAQVLGELDMPPDTTRGIKDMCDAEIRGVIAQVEMDTIRAKNPG